MACDGTGYRICAECPDEASGMVCGVCGGVGVVECAGCARCGADHGGDVELDMLDELDDDLNEDESDYDLLFDGGDEADSSLWATGWQP